MIIAGKGRRMLGMIEMTPRKVVSLFKLTKRPVVQREKVKSLLNFNVNQTRFFFNLKLKERQQRKKEQEIVTTKRVLRSILDHTDNAIVTLDSRLRLTYYNKQFLDLYPLGKCFLDSQPTMQELIRQACDYGLYPPDEVDEIISRRLVHLDQPGQDNLIETPRLDGVLVEGFCNKLPDGGHLLSYRDISARKRIIDENRRSAHLAALGTVAAGVAHEINNPIQGIINYATLIKNAPGKVEENNAFASRIIQESGRIAKITSTLLYCAKDNSSERVFTDIEDLLSRTIALLDSKVKRKGVTIRLSLPDKLPKVFVCPQDVQQVIINLVDNAYDAVRHDSLPANRKTIDVTGYIIGDDKPSLCLEILDKGLGMSHSVLRRAKDVFFTTKSASEGTGLGLSIVNDLVEKHDGTFEIESVEGEYTKASVLVPVS